MSKVTTHKYVVIDTNRYAGEFERDLVAYITGLEEDFPALEFVESVLREMTPAMEDWFHSCVGYPPGESGPAVMMATPGWSADSIGSYRNALPDEQFPSPAYLSVGFEVSEWPADSVTAWVRRRSEEFCKARGIECTAVRLVLETIATDTKTERIWIMSPE